MIAKAFKNKFKNDLAYFKKTLSIQSSENSGLHANCPCCCGLHCLQWGPEKNREGYFFVCHRCNARGDVADAIRITTGCSVHQAFEKLNFDFDEHLVVQVGGGM